MNAYNLAHGLYKARQADHTTLRDPGDAGTIRVSPTDLNVCVMTGGTTRSIQSAADVPVGVQLLLISQTSTITVSDVALGDGEFALFVVTLDSSGDNQWSPVSSSNMEALAENSVPAAVTGDISAYNETTLTELLVALDALGLIDNQTTT